MSRERVERNRNLEAFHKGRDEMNLAEFPLAAISNRFLDGRKTVVFRDEVWDEGKRQLVPRSLTISGSDRYGLPTAKDDDVLLACVQLSSIGSFHSREVHFSRYEVLKLLRWKDETKNYRRLSVSLRRWKGVTVYSDRAFYDHSRKSWVNRDFGILDNLYIYEREEHERAVAPASSWLVWNEVIFESFEAGYLKKLDWDLYCRLEDPVAKRLYRFLDKRFYHRDRLVFDLEELAFNKVRLSQNYNTAQVKRALAAGVRELEVLWELRPMEADERFRRVARGKWEVVFAKKTRRKSAPSSVDAGLERELVQRSVSEPVARQLVREHPAETVRTMIELHDWYQKRGQTRGPGFVVAGIRNPAAYVLPEGFESSVQRAKRRQAADSRKAAEQESARGRERRRCAKEEQRQERFSAFWASLGENEQREFEEKAVASTSATKREGYFRAGADRSSLFEKYRLLVLQEHFERSGAREGTAGSLRASEGGSPTTAAATCISADECA